MRSKSDSPRESGPSLDCPIKLPVQSLAERKRASLVISHCAFFLQPILANQGMASHLHAFIIAPEVWIFLVSS